MIDELIIDNITAVNDVFFQNCFYSSFFPIAKICGKKPVQYMVDDVILFKYSEESPLQIDIEYMPLKPLEVLLKETDIEVDTKVHSDTIIDDIINAIVKGRPVILWIDCFYESFRKDTYSTKHLLHSLLIYGFCKSKKTFYVVEHEHQDTLLYDSKSISFKDIEDSYKGYLDNYYGIWGQPGFNEYCITGQKDCRNNASEGALLLQYASNMLEKKELILERLEHLKKFSEAFRMVCAEQAGITDNLDLLLESLINVINSKLVTKYITDQLLYDYPPIKSQLEKVTEAWSFIRATLARIKYSSRINREAIDISIDYAAQLFGMESDYFRLVFTSLEGLKNK